MLPDNVTGGANTRLLSINKVFELGFNNLRKCYKEVVHSFIDNNPEILPDYCRYIAILTLADGLLNSVLGTNNALADVAREKNFVRGFIAQNQSRFVGGNVELDRMQAFFGKLDEPEYTYITAKALQDACNADKFDYKKLVSAK